MGSEKKKRDTKYTGEGKGERRPFLRPNSFLEGVQCSMTGKKGRKCPKPFSRMSANRLEGSRAKLINAGERKKEGREEILRN